MGSQLCEQAFHSPVPCPLASCLLRGHLGTWVLSQSQVAPAAPSRQSPEPKRKGHTARHCTLGSHQLIPGPGQAKGKCKLCLPHRVPGTYGSGSQAPPSTQQGTIFTPLGPECQPWALHPWEVGLLLPGGGNGSRKVLPAGTALQDSCHPGKREVPLGSQPHSRQAPPGAKQGPDSGPCTQDSVGAGRLASPAGTGACLRPRKAWYRWAGQVQAGAARCARPLV